MADFTLADLKQRVDDYHLMIEEVLGGMDMRLSLMDRKLSAMDARLGGIDPSANLRAIEMDLARTMAEVDMIKEQIKPAIKHAFGPDASST